MVFFRFFLRLFRSDFDVTPSRFWPCEIFRNVLYSDLVHGHSFISTCLIYTSKRRPFCLLSSSVTPTAVERIVFCQINPECREYTPKLSFISISTLNVPF
ncbi:hypothetical protein AMECASPLE_000097 [Ameca splendens]|uniref:Secreted protein n=1 Tax=Ameca splendens TaxID=208324 RepID=A0ABV0ZJ68_9TELE